jgi:alkylation response protein AidB-like acyl-CoA dehydrogenase
MEVSLEVRRRYQAGTSYDKQGKVSEETLREPAAAGYWGMLIEPPYGGQGAPFARFTNFLTRVATSDAMVAGMASIHGCIGAVDPVRTFGTPQQKMRFLPRLASGLALSGFALTEPRAGSVRAWFFGQKSARETGLDSTPAQKRMLIWRQ